MSLDDEGLNVNVEDTAADGNQNQSAVSRNQSVRDIYEGATCSRWSKMMVSLTSEGKCSKWVN